MVKVTVLYNLPPGTDEEEFIRWRTTEHDAANNAQPGVVRSEFSRILGQPQIGDARPATASAPYRFVTESWWESYESFLASWQRPEEQARLLPAVAKIADALFLVSEQLQVFDAAFDGAT